MATISEMPKSIHSDVDPSAIGEVLAKFYNVDVHNPWFDVGLSDQESYNRRRLPWSGFDYSVNPDTGRVSGPNADQVPDGLKQIWLNMAAASKNTGAGEVYEDLEELHEERLTEIGDKLAGGGSDEVTLTTVGGGTVTRSAAQLSEAQAGNKGVTDTQLSVDPAAGANDLGAQAQTRQES